MELASEENTGSRARIGVERIEWGVAVLLSLVALILFVVRTTHAGSLWRDEADSVQSAQLPLGGMFQAVQFSSFPILFPLTVRGYTTVFGASDGSLRCFGLVAGILLLALTWLPVRNVTRGVPLLLLAMIGLNTNFLIAGMSLRGYGLGSLLVLLAFVCTIRFLLNPNTRTFIALSAAELLSLHCLFWNAPLVIALTIAATGVLLLRRQLKWISMLAVLLVACGLSQIPYLLQFRSSLSGWERLIQVSVSFRLVWEYFFVAWGYISSAVSFIWLGLLALAVIGATWRAIRLRNSACAEGRDLMLFGILLIPLSILASYALAMTIHRSPEQRFFLALTILAAASADLLWANFPRWLRVARIILVIVAAVTLPFVLWAYIVQPASNTEKVAKHLEQHASPRDLIVINPWTYGVTFNWYYRGATLWVTVPQIEDHRIHRYDLVLVKMEAASPLVDVEQKLANTLQSGNRVWFAGQLRLPLPGESPLQLGPAPDPNVGWLGTAYRKAWSQEIGLFLSRHAEKGTQIDTGTGQIIGAEDLSLYQLEGWRD